MKKILILITIGIALYCFSFFNGFVWDDEAFLQQNPIVSQEAQTMSSQVYFRPAISVVYSTLYSTFGAQSFFYHFFQVLFHITTAVILFYLCKRFFSENTAFLLSLLFLVHPSNVEAVCFASAMQEILFTLMGVAGLYVLIRSKNISALSLIVSLLFFTTSLLMKETGIMFFVLACGYLLIFHRKNTSIFSLFMAFVIIVLFTYGIARFSGGNVYVQGGGLFPIMRVSFITRLINIPQIILYYLGIFIFPFHLGIAQHWVVQKITFIDFWLPLGVVAGLFSLLINYHHRYRQEHTQEASSKRLLHFVRNDKNTHIFFFFFIWFLLGLLPHLQIIPLNMTVAERWLYFPMIGLLGMIGSLIGEERSKKTEGRIVLIFLILISIFFIRSFIRTLDWRNGLALYGSSIAKTSSFDLQNNMGVELFRVGKYDEAKKYFEISTRLAPYWWVNWNNLGAAYEREKKYMKAMECYQKSMQNGDYILAYENYARSLFSYGKDTGKAEEFLKKALRLFPESQTLQMLYRP